ncbi:MAG: hypothetical protein ACLFRV_05470 [Acidimicrobiales bacterium]
MTKWEGGHPGEGITDRLCRWCQRTLPTRSGPGRPRRYCSQSCRQQAFLARKLADAHGLGDDEVIVARADLEAVQDRVALLGQAIDDIERDRRQGGGDDAEAYTWLLEHAREVANTRIEPAWTDRSELTPPE